jgi:hypothetical protein
LFELPVIIGGEEEENGEKGLQLSDEQCDSGLDENGERAFCFTSDKLVSGADALGLSFLIEIRVSGSAVGEGASGKKGERMSFQVFHSLS